ncbi:uncharacterized protein [Diabrotica undecimpunctata]|uniref:uncharacterized protein n=1 Tax=Diabrotica undecimpunctata TaxID=50387 RepID=UPI003B63AE66
MEKEPQPESMATVTIKPEYTPSEYSASEPPPAYMKLRSTSVQIAKIIAVTVVVCSVILGGFLLASAYVSANASCRQLEHELELLSEAADRFQSPLQPEALIQDPPPTPVNAKRQVETLNVDEPSHTTKELTNHIDDDDSSSSSESESTDSEDLPIKDPKVAKVPGQMDMEELISHLLEKNQKSKMNCVVEKKRAEEFVDHQPKTVRLPFGINLTTNPRFEKLTGERMVIVCESGTMQSAESPMRPKEEKEDDSEEEDQETIMIQPVMIPIPQSPFNTHMPQQMAPMAAQRPEQMRPMGAPVFHIENMRPPMMHQQPPSQMPVRPPMQPQIQIQMQPQQPQQQGDFPPNPILQHIVQQIVAQKIMESQKLREQQMREQQQQQQQQQQQKEVRPEPAQEIEERPRFLQIEQIGQPINGQRLPIPEEVLSQLNRLPNRDVIVAVSETDSEDAPQEVQYVQEQRQSANEMNGRQTYTRALPINLPVHIAPQDQESQEQEQQQEEIRPHFVQPRSV